MSLKSFFQSIPQRILGTFIEVKSERLAKPSSVVKFPIDEDLERRVKAAREAMGTIEPKSLRRIEDQPDTFVERRPFDDEWMQ